MHADPQKRAIYDSSGGDPDSRFGGRPSSQGFATSPFGNGATGFDGEISPEELFNMFFGGGGGGGPFGPGFGGGGLGGGPGASFFNRQKITTQSHFLKLFSHSVLVALQPYERVVTLEPSELQLKNHVRY